MQRCWEVIRRDKAYAVSSRYFNYLQILGILNTKKAGQIRMKPKYITARLKRNSLRAFQELKKVANNGDLDT